MLFKYQNLFKPFLFSKLFKCLIYERRRSPASFVYTFCVEYAYYVKQRNFLLFLMHFEEILEKINVYISVLNIKKACLSH